MNEKIKKKYNRIVSENGEVYNSFRELARKLNISRERYRKRFIKNGYVLINNVKYYPLEECVNESCKQETLKLNNDTLKEFEEFKKFKEIKNIPYEKYTFNFEKKHSGSRYAIALFSDAHIEEVVDPNSVWGLNEYNVEIAKQRIEKYFINLCQCLKEDNVEYLIFASLGDTISGYIHEELAQCNELSPLEACLTAQNMLYSGLCYLCENVNLKKIKFIGIVGNHSRTTKKIQHSNGYKLSYEWLMYMNLKHICELNKLNIEFEIPQSEFAVVKMDDNRTFIFMHGFQIKSSGNGTVCGIYPSLNRLSMKLNNTFHQSKIYLGHFHSCINIPNAGVNGSIIGYNTFAMSNGFINEKPCQYYEVYDSIIGEYNFRKIYCD